MVAFPHCKINMGLRVLRKRQDGYHDIETCFYPLPWNDVLEIIPAKSMSFTNTGLKVPGGQEENICLKAYFLLHEKYNLPPVAIHLHKIVPMGAGLGGGSSDGAFTLKLLNNIFKLELGTNQLAEYALLLGSDCSFFIYDKPMLGSGRGEKLKSLEFSLTGKYIVVIKPDVNVSTAEAYQEIKPEESGPSLRNILEKSNDNHWQAIITNDFETSVFRRHPDIGKIKNTLWAEGALYASMSGSGSAVFGLFDSAVDLRKNFAGMTYWSGGL